MPRGSLRRELVGLLTAMACTFSGPAQDLAPRAHVTTPLHAKTIIRNFVLFTTERWSNWILVPYAGVWFYTTNPAFYDILVPRP
jgi:hypothetical protein